MSWEYNGYAPTTAALVEFDPAKSSVYNDLNEYLSSTKVRPYPYTISQTVSPVNSDFILIDNTKVIGNLSILPGIYVGGIVSALLPGAVGTSSLNVVHDSNGNIINKIDIRHSATNDPVLDLSGNVVYGLIQSSSTVLNGDLIGAPASENTQISFFSVNPITDLLQLVVLNGAYEFRVNKIVNLYNNPPLILEGSDNVTEIIARPLYYYASLKITSDFAIGETINIQTGIGSITGIATVEGNIINLPTSAAVFQASNEIEIKRNGKILETHNMTTKEVTWISTSQIQITDVLLTGDILTIKVPIIY